jgi:aspartate/methionine/tyrosine aminotransferase
MTASAPSSGLSKPRELSRRADAMPRSAIREIMALAATRPDVIHLEVGEPDFGTPEHIIDAAFAQVRAGATKYTGNAGRPDLRERIAARVRARTRVPIAAEHVIVTVGAIGALYTALMSVLDVGDEVLIPDPGWPNYEAIAVLAGARPVRYPLSAKAEFVPDPDDIARRIGPRTKAVLLNSPGNPTGAVFPVETIAALGALAERTGIYIVSDEIYEDIVFDGRRHVSFLDHTPTDRVFVIGGASKSYAMTGWRLGWLIAPPAAATIGAKLQEPVVSCAPAPSQAAAEAALAGPQSVVEEGRRLFERRRDLFLEVLGQTGAVAATPRGAFYGLVDIPAGAESALAFAKRLLIDRGVAVVPGDTFGASTTRMVRLAFTTDDVSLRTGLERLREFLLRAT